MYNLKLGKYKTIEGEDIKINFVNFSRNKSNYEYVNKTKISDQDYATLLNIQKAKRILFYKNGEQILKDIYGFDLN